MPRLERVTPCVAAVIPAIRPPMIPPISRSHIRPRLVDATPTIQQQPLWKPPARPCSTIRASGADRLLKQQHESHVPLDPHHSTSVLFRRPSCRLSAAALWEAPLTRTKFVATPRARTIAARWTCTSCTCQNDDQTVICSLCGGLKSI